MGLMIFLIISFSLIVTALLYFVAIKYKTWITTIMIIFILSIGTAMGVVLYENLGYAKSVISISDNFQILNYVNDDSKQIFYIMVKEETKDQPRLFSFHITDKENYKKQKEGLEGIEKKQKDGVLYKGTFDTVTENFIFHQLQLNKIIEKK